MSTVFSCFVTGTDTEIGKTLISSAMLHALCEQGIRAVGMKPIASGGKLVDGKLQNEDTRALMNASNVAAPLSLVNPYLFQEPVAPHIAASKANSGIDINHILKCYHEISQMVDAIVVEGVGGFCVPLSETYDLADLAVAFGLPVVLVVGMRLGCLNHALLTAEAIAARGLPFAGWVANIVQPDMAYLEENISMLEARLQAPLLGVIPNLTNASAAKAAQHIDFSCLPSWPGQ